jgi:hypothetical protein
MTGQEPQERDDDSRPTDAADAVARALEAAADAQRSAIEVALSSELVIGRDDAQSTKVRLAGSHSQVARAHKAAMAAHTQAREMIEAQRRDLEAKLRAMQLELQPLIELSEKLQDGIRAVNLYLGRDEDLRELRDGASASQTEPLHIRQQVLAMDEETALHAKDGGLDFQDIDVFVEWVLADPSHLDQIIPEQKSVVALMARSTPLDYTGNAIANSVLNQKNEETWWLIRNGERLYLMTTNFSVGKRLIPERDEFTRMFLTSNGKSSLEPGSRDWLKAEKHANARTRHYMKVALILQGLVDRTAVFHPLPQNGLNLLSQADYDARKVVLIADDELAIGAGRPSFEDWQKERLGRLEVGRRVIGHFSSSFKKDELHRISPENASAPQALVAHTIARKDARYFYFSYDRTDTIWRANSVSSTAKTRATYTLDRDPWSSVSYIPVDEVTVEEMRYYLNSRSERHAYKNLFPALQAAIAFKEAESAVEQPFRDLLSAAIVEAGSAVREQADSIGGELITWWKTARKWNQTLNGNPDAEARAMRAILNEARRRASDTAGISPKLKASIAAVVSEPLVIARRTHDYVVIEAQPRVYGEPSVPLNLWVRVHEFTGLGKYRKSTEWKTLTTAQIAKWTILQQTDAWNTWMLDALPFTHLTDAQIGGLLIAAKSTVNGPPSVIKYFESRGEPRVRLEVCWPSRMTEQRGWALKAGRTTLMQPYDVALVTGDRKAGMTFGHLSPSDREWTEARTGDWFTGVTTEQSPHMVNYGDLNAQTVIWEDSTALALDRALGVSWRAGVLSERLVNERIRSLERQIDVAWTAQDDAERRARFIEDFGDETLWEDHRKSQAAAPFPIITPFGKPSVLSALIRRLVTADHDFAGLTIGEALTLDQCDGAGFPPSTISLRFSTETSEE